MNNPTNLLLLLLFLLLLLLLLSLLLLLLLLLLLSIWCFGNKVDTGLVRNYRFSLWLYVNRK